MACCFGEICGTEELNVGWRHLKSEGETAVILVENCKGLENRAQLR